MESDAPFEDKNIFSNVNIENFLHKHNISANIITLKELNENIDNAEKSCIIFTGDEKDEYNNGYSKHWLGLYGDYLFDSYGYQKDYKLPSSLSFVKTYPSRLQEFDSVVCGEYVCCFLLFCNKIKKDNNSQIGKDFSLYFGFSTNRKENDNIVIKETHNVKA